MSFFRSITEECVESKAKVFKTQPRKIGHCPWPQLQMARNVDSIYEGSFKGPRLTPEGHVLFVAFFFFSPSSNLMKKIFIIKTKIQK